MGKTFQEQMLDLGLVDKKKAQAVKQEKHRKKKKKASTAQPVEDENVRLAREAEEKKKARARQLNLEREQKLQQRAAAARLKQLVEQHEMDLAKDGVPYRFSVEGKIHRLFVSRELADMLSGGKMGIVGLDGRFAIVPRDIVAKVLAIDDTTFTLINETTADKEPDPDDPYAGYEVPDDLMW